LNPSFAIIKPLLQTGTSATSRWFSYIGLGVGVLLLLCSVQMFINIRELLKDKTVNKTGYDFISISKKVTNESAGNPGKNVFNEAELAEIKKQDFLEDAAPLIASQFRIKLSGGDILPVSTDFFLESLDDAFIDTVPPNFKWTEGQITVPAIISSDFFEAYNIFAPGQDLPQFSQESIMGLPLIIETEGNGQQGKFKGKIAAFSDRVNSILVPKAFLEWANKNYAPGKQAGYSRIFIKTKDANNPAFLNYVESKGYNINKDKTKFGRTKQILQGVFTGLGIFGLLVVVMALMLFSFYLQLVIARSRESLQLLLLLGYSPLWLSNKVSKRFVPVYITIVLTALALTQIMQWLFHRYAMFNREELSTPVNWLVVSIAILLIVLSVITNYRLVKKLLYKLS
jgi:hypothetical protein